MPVHTGFHPALRMMDKYTLCATGANNHVAKMATENWISIRKHRMETMQRVIYSHGLQVVTQKFARVKVGMKKRNLEHLGKVLQSTATKRPLICGVQRMPGKHQVTGNLGGKESTNYSRISEVKKQQLLFLYPLQLKVKIRVWKSKTLLTKSGLDWENSREGKLEYQQFVECRWR